MIYLYEVKMIMILMVLILYEVIVAITDNDMCTRPINGQTRCFAAYSNESLTWSDALKHCDELIHDSSKLAIDDTNETHTILSNLLNETRGRFWLGGKTEPFYWNWAPSLTDESSKPVPVFYQGCFSGINLENTGQEGASCEQICTGEVFFGVTEHPNGMERKCYCFESLTNLTYNTGCRECQKGIDMTFCGRKKNNIKADYLAVYAVGPQNKEAFVTWLSDFLIFTNGQRRCMLYTNNNGANYGYDSEECTKPSQILCAKAASNAGTCEKYGYRSALCYNMSSTATKWTRNCRGMETGYESVAITSKAILDDINELFYLNGRGSCWVRGTNMRWVWMSGNDPIRIDVGGNYWSFHNEPDTLVDRCMVLYKLNNTEKVSMWHWDNCDVRKSFICEYAAIQDGANSSPGHFTFTYEATERPESEGPTSDISISSEVYVSSTRGGITSVGPNMMTSGLHTTGSYADASVYEGNIAVIGATCGGIGLLFLVVLGSVIFIRKRRKAKKGSKKQSGNNNELDYHQYHEIFDADAPKKQADVCEYEDSELKDSKSNHAYEDITETNKRSDSRRKRDIKNVNNKELVPDRGSTEFEGNPPYVSQEGTSRGSTEFERNPLYVSQEEPHNMKATPNKYSPPHPTLSLEQDAENLNKNNKGSNVPEPVYSVSDGDTFFTMEDNIIYASTDEQKMTATMCSKTSELNTTVPGKNNDVHMEDNVIYEGTDNMAVGKNKTNSNKDILLHNDGPVSDTMEENVLYEHTDNNNTVLIVEQEKKPEPVYSLPVKKKNESQLR